MLERERDNKLLNAQAIMAAIAHETRQPLASIAIYAGAATMYLGQTPPNHGEGRTALSMMETHALRVGEGFDGSRALFGKRGQEPHAIAVNRLVLGVADCVQAEL